MKLEWLIAAAETVRTARYLTVFRPRIVGLEVWARCAGYYHDASIIVPWEMLASAEENPLIHLVEQVNLDLGRLIALRARPQ